MQSQSVIKARHAEIKRRYKWHRKHKRRSPRQIIPLRLADLAKLFAARYGSTLPDDDSGREDIAIVMHHLAKLPDCGRRMTLWLEHWAPWMTLAEQRQIISDGVATCRAWSADQLAWRLGLTMDDRTTLGITTIGAVDCSKAQRTKLRKAKDRERKRTWRKAQKLGKQSASAP